MLTSVTAAAIIILAVEAMLCLMIPLALTAGLAYVLFRTRQVLPPKLQLVRLQARRVNDAVSQTGQTITGSLASAEAKMTQAEVMGRALFNLPKKD
jgi:xanthosine utilization system XapX-like protein